MGCPLSHSDYRSLSWWHESTARPTHPRASAARRPRRRRGHRRRRASPACGRRYYLARGRPVAAGPRCSRPRSPASVRRAATAAGARPSSRPPLDALAALVGGLPTGPARSPSTRDARHRRRGRPGVDGRGHRRPLRKGGTSCSPAPAPSSPRARAEVARRPRAGASATTTSGCSTRPGGALDARRPRASAGRRTRPTARPCTPAGSCAGSPSAVERRGVTIHEGTRATAIDRAGAHRPRHACGPRSWSAPPRATPARCAGRRRELVPGLLADHRHRAAAAGDLGADRAAAARDVQRPPAPDHLRPAHRRRPAGLRRARCAVPLRLAHQARLRPRRAGLRRAARARWSTCSPCCRRRRITHAWGGPLGIPRDWCASVGLDRATGLAWAGGYVGDGVSTTNLAGRTLRDLVLGRDTDLTRLPWVGHRSRRWEPEPLRWLGVNAGLRAMRLADPEEGLTGRPSAIARAMAPLLGGH